MMEIFVGGTTTTSSIPLSKLESRNLQDTLKDKSGMRDELTMYCSKGKSGD